MSANNSEGEEIDLLVRELGAARVAQPAARPAVEAPRPGSRWWTGDLRMPSARTAATPSRFASWPALRLPIDLPSLPDLGRIFRVPGTETMVRLWVGLGALHCASMTFWPYPKTYLWGLVLYLISLALVVVTGVWGARLSWDARLGGAHTIALGTILWAVTLVANTLPPV